MICLSIGIINHPKPEGTSDSLGWLCAKRYTYCMQVCLSVWVHFSMTGNILAVIWVWVCISLWHRSIQSCTCFKRFGRISHAAMLPAPLRLFWVIASAIKANFVCKGKMKFSLFGGCVTSSTMWLHAIQQWSDASRWIVLEKCSFESEPAFGNPTSCILLTDLEKC